MNSIQYIIDGINEAGERVILWRKGEYSYELEIGSGIHKKSLPFYETEYYDALNVFNKAISSSENVY